MNGFEITKYAAKLLVGAYFYNVAIKIIVLAVNQQLAMHL